MKNRVFAFTLIELRIVVAIIAILAAIAVPNFLEAQTRATVDNVSAILEAAGSSLEKILDVTVYLTDMKGDFERFEFLRYVVAGKCMAWKNILDMRRAIDYLCSRPEVRADRRRMLNRMASRMSSWLAGQLVLSGIMGVATFIGLLLLRIPFALPLAMLAYAGLESVALEQWDG